VRAVERVTPTYLEVELRSSARTSIIEWVFSTVGTCTDDPIVIPVEAVSLATILTVEVDGVEAVIQ